jgi:hypothetical protein
MAAARRPLGAGIVTLIVVDALLVTVFAVLLAGSGLLGGAEAVDDGAPQAAPATSGEQGAAEVATVLTFASPSRNISCTIDGAATCAIADFTYSPPAVPGCTGTTGHEVQVTADGARWLCTEGAAPARASSDVVVLGYGQSIAANGFTCTSSESGMTCLHDASGHSFSLARGGATLD